MKWLVAWVLTTTLPAMAAETYEVTATTTLAVTAPATVQQTWTADCTATEPAKDASIRPQGKDLRFAAAPDEVVSFSVDDAVYALGKGAVDAYDYEGVVGAHVFARFVVRCGTDDVFDEFSVDAAAIVTAPALEPPFAVRRVDTLQNVPSNQIPAGVEVELVDLAVVARPRGDERVVVSLVDEDEAPLTTPLELSAVDVGLEGRARLSPRFRSNTPGSVTVTASLLDHASPPMVFTVVNDGGEGEEGEGEGEAIDDTPASVGCSNAGAPASLVALLVLFRRRRRC